MPTAPGWICEPCREQRHADCAGPSRCYCQHRTVRTPPEPATGPPGE